MQYDMHYYATYAMAAAAGIPRADAEVIATAAQFVDDQDVTEWVVCQSQEGILGVATAHHPFVAGVRTLHGNGEGNDARAIWVPFHFLPGAEGASFEQKLVCRKDSKVARRMLDYYVSATTIRSHKEHMLQLLGIAAHVYADTFSHYGFSGISSDANELDAESLLIESEHSPTILDHIRRQREAFEAAFCGMPRLGHGAALTHPDRPYLKWSFAYKNGERSERDNRGTFLQACEALYGRFVQFAQLYYEGAVKPLAEWAQLQETVKSIIAREGKADERAGFWTEAMRNGSLAAAMPACAAYDCQGWLQQVQTFKAGDSAGQFLESDAYGFYVAADYHRNYVLKRLLPSFGLLVA